MSAIGEVIEGSAIKYGTATLEGVGNVQSLARRLASAIASTVGQGLAAGKAMAVRAGQGIVQGVGSLVGLAREVSLFSATTSGTGTLRAKGMIVGEGEPTGNAVEMQSLSMSMTL